MKTINIGNITKIVLNIDDRIPSEKELNEKYGSGNWTMEFEHSSTNSSRRMVNPENPRRILW